MTLSVLYADDELPARQKLKRLLSAHPDIDTLYEATNGLEVLACLDQASVDVLLIDINMPQLTGLEVAQELMGRARIPFIIFVTAYDQHAVSAFEMNAVDYLLKPYTRERLYQAIDRLNTRIPPGVLSSQLETVVHDLTKPKEQTRLLVKKNEAYVVLAMADIVWVESQGNYVNIHTQQGNFMQRMTMEQCLATLGDGFYRVHRTGIVHIKYIVRLEPLFKGDYQLYLSTGQELKLSRRYKDHFFQQLSVVK